jgi:predicted PhzF superfamily epimerase YddE/YHI9
VVLYAEFPDEKEMINIAAGLNFSNSAFLVKQSENTFLLRWFTPNSEAPICGHATLASTHVLYSDSHADRQKPITFITKSGELYAKAVGQSFYELNFPILNVNEIEFTPEFFRSTNKTPSFAATDGSCLFFVFASYAELVALDINLEELKRLPYRAIIATARGVGKYDFASRYFAPKVGINEDPVCVSAHARLIPYWAAVLGKDEMFAFQASKRTAELKCKKLEDRVLISGEAVTLFKGQLNLNQLSEIKNVA